MWRTCKPLPFQLGYPIMERPAGTEPANRVWHTQLVTFRISRVTLRASRQNRTAISGAEAQGLTNRRYSHTEPHARVELAHVGYKATSSPRQSGMEPMQGVKP